MSNPTFRLYASDGLYPGAVDAAVLYKESAAKSGINIEVIREPADGYWSNIWLKKPWCSAYWIGRVTEDMMLSTAYQAAAPWNDSFWNHERFNTLLRKARAEMNEKKRRNMYVEMQRLIKDEGGVVIPMFGADVCAATDKIGHGALAVNRELDGAKAAERWWFENE